MNRTERLYALVEELRAAGDRGRTGAWLARRFEVTTRTVKRDIAALQQSGVAIWAQAGPGGGYVLDASATLPPVTFTVGEATAIAVALDTQPDLPFGDGGRSALTKLLGAMSPEAQARTADVVGRVWVRHDRAPAGRGPVARTLDEALRRQVVVVVEVGEGGADEVVVQPDGVRPTGSFSPADRRRAVEPLALGRDRGRWWLFAWSRRERAGCAVPLDRLTGAWLTTEPAPSRDIAVVFRDIPGDATALSLP